VLNKLNASNNTRIREGDQVKGWTNQEWNVLSVHCGIATLVAIGGGEYPSGFLINTNYASLSKLCQKVPKKTILPKIKKVRDSVIRWGDYVEDITGQRWRVGLVVSGVVELIADAGGPNELGHTLRLQRSAMVKLCVKL
tara:strand:- start:104 stop:520 length:417 start_codon:yes stop_codon:yes gene_type:complete